MSNNSNRDACTFCGAHLPDEPEPRGERFAWWHAVCSAPTCAEKREARFNTEALERIAASTRSLTVAPRATVEVEALTICDYCRSQGAAAPTRGDRCSCPPNATREQRHHLVLDAILADYFACGGSLNKSVGHLLGWSGERSAT